MATIKSHTDIEQSNKLAEFLPLESADMSYSFDFDSEIYEISTTSYKSWVVPKYAQPDDGFDQVIPCWSLAALINILPQSIEFKGDNYYLRFMKEYVEYANDEISITGRYLHTTGNDNLVDACVAMIEKLHELNLLSIYRCLS